MDSPTLMPAAFVGHGSPMNALESNRYTTSWRALGAAVPRPRAILVVSAHWYINASVVTAMERPRTIHDFYGFPQPLFDIEYPAPGLPDLADEVADIVEPTWVGADQDSWGIDHGSWSVLVHAFPDASIPVVQLSIDAAKPLDYHVELGAKLAELRRRGVFVLTSGNVVHNLRGVDWNLPNAGFDWAQRFDEAARDVVVSDPEAVLRLRESGDYGLAVPTPDHFIPFLYLAGMAAATPETRPEVMVEGYTYGSLSMTAYTLGLDHPVTPDTEAGVSRPKTDAPPEATNL